MGRPLRIRQRPQIRLHGRRRTKHRQLRHDWQPLPRAMELDAILAPNGLHLPHARLRQHPPHPRPRWRPRALPPLRSCHAAQAEREIHGTRPDAGHDPPARAHGLRHLQRLPEIHLLRGIKIENRKKPEKKSSTPAAAPSPRRVARLEAGEKINPCERSRCTPLGGKLS